jgi:hypothetical protein
MLPGIKPVKLLYTRSKVFQFGEVNLGKFSIKVVPLEVNSYEILAVALT